MSTDRDTTRIVRSWMEEGVTALPDRVLDAVLDQVPATPQRRSWWPARRFAQMNNLTRVTIAAAAVLVVALVGYNLLPRTGGIGGPGPSPTPIPTSTQRDLAAGTYAFAATDRAEIPFTVTVPDGWTIDTDQMISKGSNWRTDGVAFTTWSVTQAYGDACHGTSLQPAGTKALLVAVLTAQTGHQTTGPTETIIGGLPATEFDFFFAPGLDMPACNGGPLLIWPDPGPDTTGGLPMFAGQQTTIDVMEGHGKAFALVRIRNTGVTAGSDAFAELQGILSSIQFQP